MSLRKSSQSCSRRSNFASFFLSLVLVLPFCGFADDYDIIAAINQLSAANTVGFQGVTYEINELQTQLTGSFSGVRSDLAQQLYTQQLYLPYLVLIKNALDVANNQRSDYVDAWGQHINTVYGDGPFSAYITDGSQLNQWVNQRGAWDSVVSDLRATARTLKKARHFYGNPDLPEDNGTWGQFINEWLDHTIRLENGVNRLGYDLPYTTEYLGLSFNSMNDVLRYNTEEVANQKEAFFAFYGNADRWANFAVMNANYEEDFDYRNGIYWRGVDHIAKAASNSVDSLKRFLGEEEEIDQTIEEWSPPSLDEEAKPDKTVESVLEKRKEAIDNITAYGQEWVTRSIAETQIYMGRLRENVESMVNPFVSMANNEGLKIKVPWIKHARLDNMVRSIAFAGRGLTAMEDEDEEEREIEVKVKQEYSDKIRLIMSFFWWSVSVFGIVRFGLNMLIRMLNSIQEMFRA